MSPKWFQNKWWEKEEYAKHAKLLPKDLTEAIRPLCDLFTDEWVEQEREYANKQKADFYSLGDKIVVHPIFPALFGEGTVFVDMLLSLGKSVRALTSVRNFELLTKRLKSRTEYQSSNREASVGAAIASLGTLSYESNSLHSTDWLLRIAGAEIHFEVKELHDSKWDRTIQNLSKKITQEINSRLANNGLHIKIELGPELEGLCNVTYDEDFLPALASLIVDEVQAKLKDVDAQQEISLLPLCKITFTPVIERVHRIEFTWSNGTSAQTIKRVVANALTDAVEKTTAPQIVYIFMRSFFDPGLLRIVMKLLWKTNPSYRNVLAVVFSSFISFDIIIKPGLNEDQVLLMEKVRLCLNAHSVSSLTYIDPKKITQLMVNFSTLR